MQNKNIKICCFCVLTCIYTHLFIHPCLMVIAGEVSSCCCKVRVGELDAQEVVGELQYFQALLALIEKKT